MASVVSEVSIILLILVRIYRYRISSRLRWTQELFEDCVDDVKDVTKKVLNEGRVKHFAEKIA